ncbi:hypothetical protein ACFL09_06085 [Planctomycetota bacterium]
MGANWKCPGCGKVWAKGDDVERDFYQRALGSGGRITRPPSKCPNCGTLVDASDVYGGKYDVDGAGEYVRWRQRRREGREKRERETTTATEESDECPRCKKMKSVMLACPRCGYVEAGPIGCVAIASVALLLPMVIWGTGFGETTEALVGGVFRWGCAVVGSLCAIATAIQVISAFSPRAVRRRRDWKKGYRYS